MCYMSVVGATGVLLVLYECCRCYRSVACVI